MKKGIFITIIGIIIVGITYFGIEMYGFAKGVKEDSQKQIGIKKTELSKYQNAELSIFYKDFEKKITEIIWTDEPPAKLSGVILEVSENKYYEIDLDSIPELYRMNLEMNWKMSEVGNSKIRNIKLIEKN
ncbi:hypothetical protein [Psychroflexus sp. ALD_RP9]|uniref:hypothetical protein n=1 Tax=Psychroflexus sp. ALD_RP9 TaxID=2777186 RepID=UPI001A8F0F3B|nr:hypothetical protein [Psychroflexus sp. ALD_RP9]QSS96674.1 hypothetical protein IMZ30_09495 [Psychroflexus sp. ALD_RP9]